MILDTGCRCFIMQLLLLSLILHMGVSKHISPEEGGDSDDEQLLPEILKFLYSNEWLCPFLCIVLH